jgi:hypothetical protein
MMSDDADFITATILLLGTSPYSQSHMHDEPGLEGESPDDYDRRTWRHKMNSEEIAPGKRSMVIPAFGFHRALVDGAKFSKKKIVGHGNSTWTARFESGVSVMGNGVLNIDPALVSAVRLFLNSDGKRGGGKRVPRMLPQIPAGWECTFTVIILDAMVTEEIFREMVTNAGQFVGVGQFRPQNGGGNGRFVLKKLQWADNRRSLPKRSFTRAA